MSLTSLLTNDILEKIINEVKQKKNIDKIETNIIDPLIKYTFNRIYPYILILFIVLILIFLIIIIILFIVLNPKFIRGKN